MENMTMEIAQAAKAMTKQGMSVKEEIVYASDVIEEEADEVEEIVEIIEEIEEIEEMIEEEVEEADIEDGTGDESQSAPDLGQHRETSTDFYASGCQGEEDSREVTTNDNLNYEEVRLSKYHQDYPSNETNGRSTLVTYDADEDWEDEDNERQATEQGGAKNNTSGRNNSVGSSFVQKVHSMNGKRSASSKDAHYSSSNETNVEPVYKVAKTRASVDYIDARNIRNSLETDENEGNEGEGVEEEEVGEVEEQGEAEEEEEEEEEVEHEIVKSSDNDLIYTVLGSKKSTSGHAKTNRDNVSSQNQESSRHMKMERPDDDAIPIEGTIYYEGDNMETVYVAQPVNEDGAQYHQYAEQAIEHEDQEWEGTNEVTSENQEEEGEAGAEEEAVQDQIFLHEDEDGQLYFKDESGTLQPVYLTADGNYAIADNTTDEQEIPENTINHEESTASTVPADDSRVFDDDSFIVPEMDSAASSSNPNDPENEDNTVTISLIISEDENGQKRTQVIIPTTDSLKCELCAKSFKTSFQLLRHNRLKHAREEDITTRNFPCDLCPKRYTDQNTLARHRKTHIGDRPFGCLECGKSFPTSTALRRHLTHHNPQSRPLPCIYCGRRFLEKAALTKHEQSHLAGDQRTHTCDLCHKSFLQAADLNLHKKNHDPDKKFDCEVCGREFNRLNNLQRHMMVHKQKQDGNQEILACDVCGITYKFMSSLTRHMVTSHMNPEKLRQQADEQRKKRENNYRRYLENRKMYETQHTGTDYSGSVGGGGGGAGGGVGRRSSGYRSNNDNDEDTA